MTVGLSACLWTALQGTNVGFLASMVLSLGVNQTSHSNQRPTKALVVSWMLRELQSFRILLMSTIDSTITYCVLLKVSVTSLF